jgi:hypothetical protein
MYESEDEFQESKFVEMARLGSLWGKYKSKSEQLNYHRKAIRSTLMQEFERVNKVSAHSKQLRDAEADERYLQICDAHATSIELEIRYKVEYEVYKLRFEKWRTDRADHRTAMNMR